ncbi:MAG: PepSY domain-containing protein [Chthonomonadaceae bacterium]|jgi:uncharacterized membrane protein YkoI|nr:PepSY domain-containing protein [Chthonomonadaceae bacterium]
MKHKINRYLGSLLAVVTLTLASASALAQTKMQIEDASTAAIAALGGADQAWFGKGDQRVENGVEVWRFIVTKNLTTIYQVRVNAFTGAAIKVDRVGPADGDGPPITMNRAAQIGRGAKAGYVWKVEAALFNTVSVWSVKITGTDNKQYEVLVNMSTGSVLKVERRGGSGRGRGQDD